MEITTIIIALVVIFIAWKVLTGIVKFALIGAVILGALYFLSQAAA
ncbi:hypothetical protein HME9302_01245 [Alteripontixanthobacter maritimus]|uniref:Uncharacterized protein n=1 Tax=Alteripontixanthobacter maritimus TaxID=2161824 RepID=A0A369QA18_9SPHN|nr:hypothetical protein [Alteripontixanthobacter maritimus]RDC60046.1 hypothetical protein HME9302_01245 [Alteripontixanthobacter maritimus]